MNAIMVAWLAEIGIITIRDLAGPRRFPLPSELLSTFVVFGGLGLLGEAPTTKGAASATAWGIVVATLLSAKVDFLKPVGDFFGGAGTPAAPAGSASGPPGGIPRTGGGGGAVNVGTAKNRATPAVG